MPVRFIEFDIGLFSGAPAVAPDVPVMIQVEGQPAAVSLGQPIGEGERGGGNTKLALTLAGVLISLL